MIARCRFLLPIKLQIHPSDHLATHTIEFEGYRTRILPPYFAGGIVDGYAPLTNSLDPAEQAPSANVTIDNESTHEVNALQFEFLGEFDRRAEAENDVLPRAFRLFDLLMARYRSLSNAFFLRPREHKDIAWRVRYLDDKGEEFTADPEGLLLRGRGASIIATGSVALMLPEIWSQLHRDDIVIPASEEILLDAMAALPHVGTSIALAKTAIEVRISTALDILASENTDKINAGFWEWVTDRRGNRGKQPSVDEELTDMVKLFVDHSLIDNKSLWSAYLELKKARNNFAHEGSATLNMTKITVAKAAELVNQAREIVDWIESFLPARARRCVVPLPVRQIACTVPILT